MSRRHTGLIFPPGTFQTPKFYWRGGDEFKEQEQLQNEYNHAKQEHSQIKRELQELQSKYDQAKADLAYKDDQACSLASALGSNSATTGENAKLNKEIQQLTQEISEIEAKITQAALRAQPSYIASLEKEKSALYVTVEQQQHDADTTTRAINNLSQEFFSIITSQEWRESYLLISENQIKTKERSKIRQEVNKLFENQNYGQEIKNEATVRVRPGANQHLQELSNLIDERDALQAKLYTANHNRYMAQTTRNILIAQKLEILSQLNNALEELDLEKNDIDALREKYLPDSQMPSLKRPSSNISRRTGSSPKTIRRPISQSQRY